MNSIGKLRFLKLGGIPVFSSFFLTTLLYLKFFVPNFFSSVYAEDGQIYLNDALTSGGLNNLFKTYAGYVDLPARLIAALTILFDPAFYPFILGFGTISVMTICMMVIYYACDKVFQNKSQSALFAGFLLVLPISRFESLGNVTNLHFYIFTSSSFVFIQYLVIRRISLNQGFFVLIATLSTPLTLFLMFFSLYGLKKPSNWNFKTIRLKNNPFIILGIGTLINIVVSWGDLDTRTPTDVNSVAKSGYLYLDRVIGSALIPFWGRVSTNQGVTLVSSSIFNSLYIRAALTFLILLLVLYIARRTSVGVQPLLVIIFSITIIYSIILSMAYNLEPRYAIFPSYLISFIFFVIVIQLNPKFATVILFCFVLLMNLNSASTTLSRYKATDWTKQVKFAKLACNTLDDSKSMNIRIAPFREDAFWFVNIPCSRITEKN